MLLMRTHNVFIENWIKHCGYSLVAPHQYASNEYPQHVFMENWRPLIVHYLDRIKWKKSAFEHVQMHRCRSFCTWTSFISSFALHSYILSYPMILLADSEGPDQTVWMWELIWALAACICSKTGFPMAQSILPALISVMTNNNRH